MAGKRNERLRELFLHEISAALRGVNGLNSHGLLTLTGTDLTRDGKILYVYYSVLGTPEDRRRKELLLNANIRDIRSLLFRRLRLKVIPEIVFKFDETPEKASHLEDIFKRIRSENEKNDENTGP
ncbi:MAG: ribosome-binding factor A [Elusimicrobia bacterium]|nr:ribosome-binding factor A [Elusimicrobiota bacterium]